MKNDDEKLSEQSENKDNFALADEENSAKNADINIAVEENGAQKGSDESKKDQKTDAQSCTKFKNPEELFKAYRELEKEFTRRSQRLAQLENVGEIKDRSEDEWKQKVEEFFNQTPAAKPFAKDIAKELIAHPELKSRDGCLDTALTRVLVEKYRSPEQLLLDGEFLNKYVLSSPAVKKAVVESYLRDLEAGIPPVVLCDGGEINIAPSSKPKTVSEAGALFYKQQK